MFTVTVRLLTRSPSVHAEIGGQITDCCPGAVQEAALLALELQDPGFGRVPREHALAEAGEGRLSRPGN
jgi:hypothetical protein